MPMPSGRPGNVIDAIRNGFNGRTVWPKASADPGAHYQRLGVMYNYLAETPEGFVLTDLGRHETLQGN
jgi:hypothetical protein